MNEEPNSIWKKSWTGPRGHFLFWLLVLVAAFLIIFAVGQLARIADSAADLAVMAVIWATILAVVGFLTVSFIRWLGHWRNFKRFLFGLACFITLLALFYAEENWRGKHDWEKFKQGWEAKDVRFGPASVIPAAVPADENFAMAPVFNAVNKLMDPKWRAQHRNPHQGEAGDQSEWDTNMVNRLEMSISENGENPTNGIGSWQRATMSDLAAWQRYYRELAATTNEFPVAPQPQSPARDVLLALSRYASTIEELREAAGRPDARFPIAYDTEPPAAILLPHLSGLRRVAKVLQLRAIAELQNGQSDKALAEVKLLLRLGESIRTEPFLISHLVRVAIVNLAIQPVWEGLVAHRWSEAELAELDSELAKVDLLADYHVAMRGELMLCEIGDIEYLRRHPERAPDLFEAGGLTSSSRILARVLWRAIPNGWFYQNELGCARPMLEYYLPMADTKQRVVRPGDVARANAAVVSASEHSSPYNFLVRLFMPGLGAAVKKSAFGEASVDLARVAIALERYRLVNEDYPESLDMLAPQFIAKLPHDIINGEPLHYRRRPDGQFVLYSVGWNETDEGGVVGRTRAGRADISKGDWVWNSSAVKN
jgi:tetratricopeptide (TPR) repeat protein